MPIRPLTTAVNASIAKQQRLSRAVKAGRLRRIYPGVYTQDLVAPLEDIVQRNYLAIAAVLAPGCVLSARSSIEFGPCRAPDGSSFLFLSHAASPRVIRLPGMQIQICTGPGILEGDFPYTGLFAASEERRLLENLVPSRARAGVARTLGQAAVERFLDSKVTQEGEGHINDIRDRARVLAPVLGLEAEFAVLDGIIGSFLGTRTFKLVSQVARARSANQPYDPDCRARLDVLRDHLALQSLPEVPDTAVDEGPRAALSFVEAYFSNYIEGTRFMVDDARRIVFEGWVPPQRPRDGRDVSLTYLQLMDLGRRSPSSLTYAELEDEITSRHRQLMAARPEISPGTFKALGNYAGSTVFVHPDLVEGTLRLGVSMLGDISHPFARAVFLHFLLTDVHPFADGNGRLSRIMMTKELVSSGLSRIVIPNSFRDDYLSVLRQLSRDGRPDALVRGLAFCQRATAAASARDVGEAIQVWAGMMAFQDSNDPEARFRMPDPAAVIEWREGVPAPRHYWSSRQGASTPFGI